MYIKRTLALFTALAALLALAGCAIGGSDDVLSGLSDDAPVRIGPATEIGEDPFAEPTAEPTPEPTAEPTPEPTAEPTPEPTAEPTPKPTAAPTPQPTPEPDVFGAVDGGVYRNDYFGVNCTLAEGWRFLDQAELDALLEDTVTDPALDGQVTQDMRDFLASGDNACVMAACGKGQLQNVNVVVTYLAGLGEYLSEEELLRLSLGQLGADETGDLASIGLEGAQPQIGVCSFAGGEHACLRADYTDTSLGIEIPIHLQIVYILREDYAMQVTMSSTFDDAPLAAIAAMFSADE